MNSSSPPGKDAVRSVLITGAAGGIGQALCDAFHGAGWHVIGAGRTKPEGATCDGFVELDLDRFAVDDPYRAGGLDRIRQALPDGRLDCLVNNAALQVLGATEDVALDDWERSFRVNLTGPFLLTQGLLPELEAASGNVLNIGSIHAKLTKPGFVTYATTKAALEGLTRALAVDVGARVRVNLIAPAAIRTPMLEAGFEGQPEAFEALEAHHPVGGIGEPSEVGDLAVYVAEAPGRFLNGAILGIDGGIGGRLHDPVPKNPVDE